MNRFVPLAAFAAVVGVTAWLGAQAPAGAGANPASWTVSISRSNTK